MRTTARLDGRGGCLTGHSRVPHAPVGRPTPNEKLCHVLSAVPTRRRRRCTIAGRPQEKLVQAQQELGQVHTAVMGITDEGDVDEVFAGLTRVDRRSAQRYASSW